MASNRESAERHEAAALSHDKAVARHEASLGFWAGRGDVEMAALERRGAELERQLAQYERDRAALLRSRG